MDDTKTGKKQDRGENPKPAVEARRLLRKAAVLNVGTVKGPFNARLERREHTRFVCGV